MNKKLTVLFLLPLLMLSSCGQKDGSDTDEEEETTETSQDGKSDEEKEAYDNWLTSISKPGHLYFHYNRGENKDYDNYCLWLWQHAPNDLEGSLWAFSGNPAVSSKLTLSPMSTHWMSYDDVGKSDEGSGDYIDDYGVIADVDLYKSGLVGGKTGSVTSFEGASQLGFLLPRQNSMDGKTNWVSDGGKETYVDDFDDPSNWRTLVNGGKAVHLFVTSGSLKKYSYFVGSGEPQQVVVNPITTDTTGDFRSDAEDYSDIFDNSSTSDAFKNLGVGYQIFVASFADSNGDGKGDIRGIINALPYLKRLGVQCLWLTPIQKSDSYHGYDTIDYYKIDEKFGTLEDYRELIYRCHHEYDMKVIMDLVLNHTSKSNVWFENSQWGVNEAGRKNEWRDVYTWKYKDDEIYKYTKGGGRQKITVKQDAESENPSWYRDGESNYYYYGKFGGSMPEINYYSPKTREMVIEMAKYWLGFGLDGYRLDAVKHIFMRDECGYELVDKCIEDGDIMLEDYTSKTYHDDEKGSDVTINVDYATNLSKNLAWWKEFANAVKADYPNCFLVGENFDGWGKTTAPYYQALDSQFSFSHYYHIPTYLYEQAGMSAHLFNTKQAAESYDCYATTDWVPLDGKSYSVPGGGRVDFIDGAFTSNHDVMRAINQVNGTLNDAGDGTNPLVRVPYKYDGKDSQGQDIWTQRDNVKEKAKIHAAVTLLNRGLSWIYYGDELGMSSNTNQHKEKYTYDNNIDIWYRQPMKWGDTSIRTNYRHGNYLFELDDYNISDTNVPDSDMQEDNPNSMFNWYKDLIEIKKMYPKDARIFYHEYSSDNVMVLRVCDSSWNTKLVIYINTGLNTNSYDMMPTGVAGTACTNVKTMGGAPASGDIGTHPFSISVFKAGA